MKITSIKQQLKNTERASIFIDSKYSFSLSLSELVAEKLKIGMDIDEPEFKRLKKISDDGKLRSRAMEWVMNRPRSIREFRTYMYRKKAEPEFIDRLITEFESRGYLDEVKFADWLTDLRRRAGKSERAITAELSAKGISHQVSSQVLEGGKEQESTRIKSLILKKRNLSRYKENPDKLIQYLVRQGFSYQDVKAALEDDSL